MKILGFLHSVSEKCVSYESSALTGVVEGTLACTAAVQVEVQVQMQRTCSPLLHQGTRLVGTLCVRESRRVCDCLRTTEQARSSINT